MTKRSVEVVQRRYNTCVRPQKVLKTNFNTTAVAAVVAAMLIRKYNLGPLNRFSFVYKKEPLVRICLIQRECGHYG